MEALNETLKRALPVVAVHNLLQLNPDILHLCKRVEPRVAGPGVAPRGTCVTWRPSNSVFFTLIKTNGDTLIYCHGNDEIYYTPPNLKLPAETVPPFTGILCQWCEDRGADGKLEPHLLLFDIINAPNQFQSETARGDRLRSMATATTGFPPLCVLQWIGFKEALVDYVPKLPHAVDGLLLLCEDPLHPILLSIPQQQQRETSEM